MAALPKYRSHTRVLAAAPLPLTLGLLELEELQGLPTSVSVSQRAQALQS